MFLQPVCQWDLAICVSRPPRVEVLRTGKPEGTGSPSVEVVSGNLGPGLDLRNVRAETADYPPQLSLRESRCLAVAAHLNRWERGHQESALAMCSVVVTSRG